MDKKKLYKILGIAVGVIVLIIAAIVIYVLVVGINKKPSFSGIESELISAAKNYYNDNADKLPAEPGTSAYVSSSELTSGKYIEDLSKLTSEKISCSGNVTVFNNSTVYLYFVKLDCGDEYSTKNFKDYILETDKMTFNKSGIYKEVKKITTTDENSVTNTIEKDLWVYKGENPNNYLIFGDRKWRIISFDNDKIELMDIINREKSSFDNRYNVEMDSYTGKNDYSLSRIRENLNDYYETNITADMAKYILINDICIGARDKGYEALDGVVECSKIMKNEIVSILPLYETVRASLDENCKYGTDACGNYNFITDRPKFWTLTASNKNSASAYISSDGFTEIQTTKEEYNYFPIIYITTNIFGVTGDGSYENPYLIPIGEE